VGGPDSALGSPFEVAAGDLRFRGWAAGPADGRLVLLLHGFPQTSWCWRRVLPALAGAGYRAVAFDQRGYSPGARPEGVEHYGVEHLVADVLAVADDMGGHRFDLVGHDWGGMVAWHLAGRYPDRLRSLAVLSTPHPAAFRAAFQDPSSQQLARSAYVAAFRAVDHPEEALLAGGGAGLRALFASTGLPEEEAAPYLAELGEPSALGAAIAWYKAAGLDSVEGLAPAGCPTLYVWGAEDPVLVRETAMATGAHVGGPYRFVALEGAGHWLPELHADQVVPALLDHLAATG
jgi:pimeloyl-ACP methyl ester carboxylesterase